MGVSRDQAPETVDAWLRALPGAGDLPFWPPPNALYSVATLYDGLSLKDPRSWRETWDARVYGWTIGADGRPRSLDVMETVATRLHDAAMDRLVRDFVDHEHSCTIGFMGGHDIPRSEAAYVQVARIAREFRRRGFKIVTGGGPGLMEAANLGAFLAPFDERAFDEAIGTLREEPDTGGQPGDTRKETRKAGWIQTAALVRERLLGRWDADVKPGGESLGIPTWYYGFEPPNLFASACGKYFMNSLREDGLVSVANGGLVFGKGSAGTVQEVFQNANYNYYRGRDQNGRDVEATPMVFLDVDFWDPGPATDAAAGAGLDPKRKPVLPLVRTMAAEAVPDFTGSLMLTNDTAEVVDFLTSQNIQRPPRRADLRLACLNAVVGTRNLATE